MATTSASCQRVPKALIRTMAFGGRAAVFSVSRAASFSLAATASSRSTMMPSAPEDAAWFNLGDADGDGVSEGPDETFYLSGQSYYEVLWTEPAGNAYYILAHAYIAAQLNGLDGASSTAAVDAALDWAETFFMTYEPADPLSKSVRAKVVGKAEILDSYNNGLIGPGHCSE